MVKKKILSETNLEPLEKRTNYIVDTFLPYIWGYSPESIRQTDYYHYKDVNIATVQVRQEKLSSEYWFFAAPMPQQFEAETTAFLPKPYQHDKWQQIHFNEAIESPDFKQDYGIYTSEFMHSYYLLSKDLVEAFLALPAKEKWLVARKNTLYWILPKSSFEVDITKLDEVEKNAQKEATTAMQIVDSFWAKNKALSTLES